jgi:D-alanine-D-alanine ligase-like ATP-grasp enzyme
MRQSRKLKRIAFCNVKSTIGFAMNNLWSVSNRDVAVFINDFDQEYADGLVKLAHELKRPLTGIILVDKDILRKKQNSPDTAHLFEQVVCDFNDDRSLATALRPYAERLLLATCSGERNQSYLKRALPHMPYILGPTESSLDWAVHKAKMRELMGAYDPSLVPRVQHITAATETQIRQVLDKLSFPVVVKPTGLAASVLVSKAHNETELRKVIKESFAVIEEIYQRDSGRGEPSMIVEEFIEGDMYSVDAYINQTGKVWVLPLIRSLTGYAAGKTGFHIHQEDSKHDLTPAEIKAGHHAAAQAMHALGLRSCVAHIELFKTADGWKAIELGARAGGQRQYMYEAAYDTDHAYNELRLKVGLDPIINHKPVSHFTIVRTYTDKDGILERVEGYEAAKANPSMYHIRLRATPGTAVSTSDKGGKVIVDAVLRNTDLDQLYKDADLVRDHLKVIVKEP